MDYLLELGYTIDTVFKVVVDSNGNTWKYTPDENGQITEEDAIKIAGNGCKNCIRCDDCYDCDNCIDCVNCYQCKDCYDCLSCKKSIHCRSCIECTSCVYCVKCTNCIHSKYLTGKRDKK